MKTPVSKLIVVLPCHTLEDFPTHLTGVDAHSLLANWTALWHPGLIMATESTPKWVSQDFVDQDLSGALILSPTTCGRLPDEVEEVVKNGLAHLVTGKVNRREILEDPMLDDLIRGTASCTHIPDFFALGYAFLQIQIMTRQLRYSTTLDIPEFENRLFAAAAASKQGESKDVEQEISHCFDMLLEEKNNFYPTEPNLIDLVLVPPSGKLKNQLEMEHRYNLALSGSGLQRLRQYLANGFSDLANRINDNQIGFVVSGQHELPTTLVSIESVIQDIEAGKRHIDDALGHAPATYGSFKHTLSPQFPALLDQAGFESVIHASFSGGRVPITSSPVINWQGIDGTNIPALSVTPMDANSADGFLKLGPTIGEMLDGYHHVEILFCHWPGTHCDYFEDLIRIERYGALLGRFKTTADFNGSIYDSGFSDSFEAEDYRYPYLEELWKQKVINPISLWSEYWSLHYRLRAIQTTLVMAMLSDLSDQDPAIWQEMERLHEAVNRNVANYECSADLVQQIESLFDRCSFKTTSDSNPNSVDKDEVLINPTNAKKSAALEMGGQVIGGLVDGFHVQSAKTVVDFVHRRDPDVLVENGNGEVPSLKNEFFEVAFDSSTGGVQSINRLRSKGNLCSQQLAIRTSHTVHEHGFPRQRSRYSNMRCEKWDYRTFGKFEAAVISTGHLLDGESELAEFKQLVTVKRGDRQIYFDLTVDLKKDIAGPPWRNYLANRMAWPNEDAAIFRSENEISDRVYQEKFNAPNFVEIRSDDAKLTLLTGGMPFHRRSHRRMLDTILLVENERCRRFKFALAVDAPTSIGAAIAYLTPMIIARSSEESPVGGWLFHLNCKNVVMTHVRPKTTAGQLTGVSIRIQESEGRSGDLAISCPRPVKSAVRTNLPGDPLFELKFEDDVVHCGFLAFQLFQLEIDFAK